MIDPLFSKNMHLHTERKGSYFPKNSINEISQRYDFAIKYCDRQNILEIGPGTGLVAGTLFKDQKNISALNILKKIVMNLKRIILMLKS